MKGATWRLWGQRRDVVRHLRLGWFGLLAPWFVVPLVTPVELRAQTPVVVQDSVDVGQGWFGLSYGLRFHAECQERAESCFLMPGASLQVDLGSRLALQGSVHTLWTLEDFGTFRLFATRAKFYVSGGLEEERLFAYGMVGLQPWNHGNTFRIRALGIGWEWAPSTKATGSVDIGVLQSTSFSAGYQLVIGAEIHLHRSS